GEALLRGIQSMRKSSARDDPSVVDGDLLEEVKELPVDTGGLGLRLWRIRAIRTSPGRSRSRSSRRSPAGSRAGWNGCGFSRLESTLPAPTIPRSISGSA